MQRRAIVRVRTQVMRKKKKDRKMKRESFESSGPYAMLLP